MLNISSYQLHGGGSFGGGGGDHKNEITKCLKNMQTDRQTDCLYIGNVQYKCSNVTHE